MEQDSLRSQAAALGVVSMIAGAAPALAPRFFSRLFGLAAGPEPTEAVLLRSVGVRDAVIGTGLWSAAAHGGNYKPWVLARLLSDAGDTLAALLAMRSGARDRRFLALGALAAIATVVDAYLYCLARRAGTPSA